jgi:hypothetical protein
VGVLTSAAEAAPTPDPHASPAATSTTATTTETAELAPAPGETGSPPSGGQPPAAPVGLEPPSGPPPAESSPRTDTPEQAVIRHAIRLMDDLAGVKAAMGLLAEAGQAPAAAASPSRPDAVPVPVSEDPAPAPSQPEAPLTGGAPSGAAGAASSGTGSAALYALLICLAATAGGLWGRLQLVPVRWRSVAIVALNERPG